jgi:hypothetical protein
MECPFCAEIMQNEAIVCKHCSRDLRVVRPVILEIQEIVGELDKFRRELKDVTVKLNRLRHPIRYYITCAVAYVLIPTVLLVTAHVVVTIVLNVTPLILRLASLIIPLPFGLALNAISRIQFRGALVIGMLAASFSVLCMLAVTGVNDGVPILPGSWVEWREVLEYIMSIVLAFGTGNILGFLILQALPTAMTRGGKPNAIAHKIARVYYSHVGDEQLGRRARFIQGLIRTAIPLAGVVVTATGSVYAGLKGALGW